MDNQEIVRGIIQSPPASFEKTIPANGIEEIYYDYDYVRITEGTFNRGDLEFRFSETGQPAFLQNGIGVQLKVIVTRLAIKNTTGSPITITVDLGIGRIFDDRLSISGVVDVGADIVTFGYGDALRVYDQAIKDEVTNFLNAAVENNFTRIQIAPKTNLDGASYATVSNTTSTVVTAVANTDGVLIRRGLCRGTGTGLAEINVGGNPICWAEGVAGSDYSDSIEDYRVPSGVAVEITSNATVVDTMIWYEVM